jgi:recombinational DNA repair protein RecR
MELRGARNVVSTGSDNKSQKARPVCEVCGKSSTSPICQACADKIRAEAVARKKREDKGLE